MKKEVINFEDSKKGYITGFRVRKGKEEII